MKDPLDPAVTIALTLFDSFRELCALLPAVSLAVFSTLFTLCSKDSKSVRPGWHSRWCCWACSINSFTWIWRREKYVKEEKKKRCERSEKTETEKANERTNWQIRRKKISVRHLKDQKCVYFCIQQKQKKKTVLAHFRNRILYLGRADSFVDLGHCIFIGNRIPGEKKSKPKETNRTKILQFVRWAEDRDRKMKGRKVRRKIRKGRMGRTRVLS